MPTHNLTGIAEGNLMRRGEEDGLAQRRKGAKEAVRMLQLFTPLFWAGGFGVWMKEC